MNLNTTPKTLDLCRLETARNWRAFQRCQALRRRIIRIVYLTLPSLTLLIWELLRK